MEKADNMGSFNGEDSSLVVQPTKDRRQSPMPVETRKRMSSVDDNISTVAPSSPIPASLEFPWCEAIDAAFVTPPTTPRKAAYCPYSSSPPPAPTSLSSDSLLVQALRSNSLDSVKKALLNDPDVARMPLWEHKMEPPLCCALNNKCSIEIIRILMEHGADPDMQDVQGRKPSDILRSIRSLCHNYKDLGMVQQLLGIEESPVMRPFNAADWLATDPFESFEMQPPWASAEYNFAIPASTETPMQTLRVEDLERVVEGYSSWCSKSQHRAVL